MYEYESPLSPAPGPGPGPAPPPGTAMVWGVGLTPCVLLLIYFGWKYQQAASAGRLTCLRRGRARQQAAGVREPILVRGVAGEAGERREAGGEGGEGIAERAAAEIITAGTHYGAVP